MHTRIEFDCAQVIEAAERCEFFLHAADRYRSLGRTDDLVRSLFMAESNAALGFFFAGDRSTFARQTVIPL